MGKRRERRKVGSSRRVKLDIFQQPPSGDSGGSPAQDELEVDIDPRHRDESPNSPSSSDKQPENPLMLLGQYSDDESDEKSSQRVSTSENPSAVDYEQVNGKMVTENKGETGEMDINLDAPSVKENVLDEYEPGQIDATGADRMVKEEVGVEETPLSDTVDLSSNVDVSTSWKVVLDEESGQYYYWNTVTGETSWVVPDVLVAGPELTDGQETVTDAGNSSSLVAVVEQLNPALDVGSNVSPMVLIGHNSIASDKTDELAKKNELGSHLQESNGEQKDKNVKDDKEVSDAGQADQNINNFMVNGNNDLDTDSSSILRHCESLLDRFKSMEGSRNQVGGTDWISRYVLEVEIRLSDAKSLLSFGSSLLPFWVHCERKLKELEASFNAEVCQFFIDETQAVEATHASQENEEIETESNKNDSSVAVSDFEKPYVSDYVDTSTVIQKDQQSEAAYTSVLSTEHVSSLKYSPSYSDSSFEAKREGNEYAQNTEVILEPMLQVEDEDKDDDMDMDVDMEVEDAKELNFHPNPPVETIHLTQEDFNVPPPPGEDWVPPPPPDSEPVPPPPPDSELVPPPPPLDDAAEPFYPPPPTDDQTEPSYTSLPTYATIQPLSYAEQYSFSYPSSTFEYYGQTTTEFPAITTYQQTDGSHGTNSSVYYGSLPPSYPNAAPVLVNPVESVAYYGLRDGTVIHGSVVSGAASSGLHVDSGGGGIDSDKISSLNSETKTNHASPSNADHGGSAANGDSGLEHKGTSIVQTPVSIANSVIQSGPMPSAAAATVTSDVAKSAVTNTQSKVMRSKKRSIAAAPTLRSNKKVSSLVDKWKAAKEELHNDEEDEPEDACEILEKKRQREIEKWKKQQIASGEAKENANFQPLGGDWRERVKRKRAQLKKEDRKATSQDTSDVKKKPDLDDLSRDLPAGWQAYWDESSKQVYYGNTITSETTWTRPGK